MNRLKFCPALLAIALLGGAAGARAQGDTTVSRPGPEIGFAIGGAFPQGNFTRNVSTGLDLYLRFSVPIKPSSGLSLYATGSGVDFKAENQGAILDSTGAVTSASQDLDFRSAAVHVGFQWAGAWEKGQIRPRIGVALGPHFVETKSQVRVDGLLVDSLSQANEQTRWGLRFQVGSEWVLRNNVGLTLEFKLDNIWNVAQYEVSDGTSPAEIQEKSVAYVSFLLGLMLPL
jgi:hypothetical protein